MVCSINLKLWAHHSLLRYGSFDGADKSCVGNRFARGHRMEDCDMMRYDPDTVIGAKSGILTND